MVVERTTTVFKKPNTTLNYYKHKRQMDTQFIAYNPFRVLGVTTEASAKQIISNESRIKAYSKVGKTIDFPTDALLLLPPVERNEETATAARAAISQPVDRLKNAFFWFVNATPVHRQAIECLSTGDVVNARQILANDSADCLSSYNLGVLDLIELNTAQGAARMLAVLRDEHACNRFVTTVTAGAASFDSAQTSQLFLNEVTSKLGQEVIEKLMREDDLSNDDKSRINRDRIAQLTTAINQEVEKAQATDAENSIACLEAGRSLAARAAEPLAKLREIVGEYDQQYILMADRLAEAVLSCGINYFNHSFDPNSAETALGLYHQAARIAVGQLQRERCNKEICLLNDIKAQQNLELGNFPEQFKPLVEGISGRIKDIQKENLSIASINNFLSFCAPDLRMIGNTMGTDNAFYLALSSAVANNALNAIIVTMNEEQNRITQTYAYPAAHIRSLINEALDVMEKICALDMNNEVTARYNHNVTILNNISAQFTPSYSSTDLIDDNEEDGCGSTLSIIGTVIAVAFFFIRILVKCSNTM